MQDQILTDLGAALVNGSLTDEALLAETDTQPVLSILPDANVVKIGGQSIIDRGRAAVFPLLDEIVANLARHKLVVGAGAGARARHAYSVGLDLGMPTGVMSVLGTFISMQNARMLHYLLAKHGIPFVSPVEFAQLPLYLEERRAVVFFGMPPYIYWQPNPATGQIPPHRTDTGAFLVSDVFGARSIIYVKDQDGLYTADPKKDPSATRIDRITYIDALQRGLKVVDSTAFSLCMDNRMDMRVFGMEPAGNVTRALLGDEIGTRVTA